jgi:hypothetical protein
VATNWTTYSELATAGGTLVLAVATFGAVRSANRAARIAERSFQIGLRPILTASRLEDPPQKIMFQDRHWFALQGGRAAVAVDVDGEGDEQHDVVYLAMLVRNVGSGLAQIEAWQPHPGQLGSNDPWGDVEDFTKQTRALIVPPGDVTFWQGALRDPDDAAHAPMVKAVEEGALTVDLLYRDHEGGQRTVSRFSLVRRDLKSDEVGEPEWWVNLSRHRTVD